MDYKELAEKAREIDAKATPGPWMWDLRECNHQCLLTTTHSGKYYVMGFQRWGLQDALPSFQVYDRYEGQMKDRGSHGMVRADKLSKSYPGKEHHYGFDNFINHPDARYIAESRELFHQMATAITELLARAETSEERCKELEERCKRLNEARERANEAAHKWETMYRGKREELEISQNEVSTMSTAGMEMLNAFSEYVRNGSKNPAAYCYYGAAGCGGDGDGCKGVAHCNFLPKSGMTG